MAVEPPGETSGAPAEASPEATETQPGSRVIPQVSLSSFGSNFSFEASYDVLNTGRSSAADAVRAGFFKIDTSSKVDVTQLSSMERMQYYINITLKSSYFDAVVGSIMLFDVFLMISDVDARGSQKDLPLWMDIASNLCLAFYTVEFFLSLFVHGPKMFRNRVIFVDAFVIFIGYLELLLILADVADASQMGVLRIVRVIRMMRLIRTARNSPALKELRKLVMMLASCLRILVWSSVFLLIVQTIWGMMAVEFLQPVMRDLIRDGEWSDCDLCQTAFSSVMRANLTLFKTIVAGDSWGMLAEPMIVHDPSTGLIFFGSFLSLVFGVMNLVVAVVVDTAAEQRQKDVMSLAQDMEDEQGADMQLLTDMFRKIDKDCSGELELDELIKGAEEVPEFQSRLRVMDIDSHDLTQLFHMLDADGGGSISPDEFKHALNRWIYDSKTATRFIKYDVMKIGEEQKSLAETVRGLSKRVEKSIEMIAKLKRLSKHTTKQSGEFVMPPLGVAGSEALHSSEGLHSSEEREPDSAKTVNSHMNSRVTFSPTSSEGEPDSAKTVKTVNSHMNSRVTFSPTRCGGLQAASQGDVLETMTCPSKVQSSATLLEAGMAKDHIVSELLEKAYRVLRESALAAAEASLQDAAAEAGLHVRSVLHDDSLAINTSLGVKPGEQGPKAAGGTSQSERMANDSAGEISQSHGSSYESVNFGPRSAPFMPTEKPEDELMPDWGGPGEFESSTHKELPEHVVNVYV